MISLLLFTSKRLDFGCSQGSGVGCLFLKIIFSGSLPAKGGIEASFFLHKVYSLGQCIANFFVLKNSKRMLYQ